ncbi:methyltransferase domain-containing protein [Deinococcus radiomollis]|uniref:class I SAM-dependent methyltransferase n=1 Tax=Deinococcus radiomollis TaxID=468916 RepID=UPI0038916302
MNLEARDALLTSLTGESWPFAPLLDAVWVMSGARVLDIGGGDGGLLRELAQWGHTGRRELIDPLHGTDAHALPFQGATFDEVFMVRVLGHLHRPALALAEAWRVLSPGGRLTVAAHGPEHLAGMLEPGAVGAFPFDLPGMQVRAFEVCRPVVLSVESQHELAVSYGQDFQPTGTVRSRLQLTGWSLLKSSL